MNYDDMLMAIYRKDKPVIERAKALGCDLHGKDGDGRTHLMHAILAENPDPEIVSALLDQGSDPNHHDKGQGWTALHFACRDGSTELVALLLRHGVDVNATDIFGNTPLHRAIMANMNEGEIAKMLCTHRADSEKQNNSGVSPRSLASTIARSDLIEIMDQFKSA